MALLCGKEGENQKGKKREERRRVLRLFSNSRRSKLSILNLASET
jgi:hypothetical protein